MLGHLQEILAHINYVRGNILRENTEICERLFKALNKIWTAFNDFQEELRRADISSLTQLLIEGVPNNYIEKFLNSRELQAFFEFKPHIMNYHTLRKRGYRPDVEIDPHLLREAAQEHRQLVKAYKNWKDSPSCDTKEVI